jgi:hypothetical protein
VYALLHRDAIITMRLLRPVIGNRKGANMKRMLKLLFGFTDRFRVGEAKRKITEAGSINDQLMEAGTAQVEVIAEIELTQNENDARCKCFEDEFERRHGTKAPAPRPFENRHERVVALWLYAGALAAMALDSAVSALLAKGWLDVSRQTGAKIGAATAIILSLVFKACFFGATSKSQQPQVARRHLVVANTILFAVTVLLAGIVLASRSPLPAIIEFQITATGLSFAALGLVLPILAGALMALAHDFSWSHSVAVDQTAALRYLAQLNSFLDWTKRFISSNREAEDDQNPRAGQAPPAPEISTLKPALVDGVIADRGRKDRTGPLASIAGAFLISLGLTSQVGSAGSRCSEALDIFVDDTSSVDEASRDHMINRLSTQLPQLINSCKIRIVEVVHFSANPWKDTGREYRIPEREAASCKGADVPSELEIFVGMTREAKAQARSRCQPEQDAKDRRFKSEFDGVVVQVTADMRSRASTGPCTAIGSLLRRISQTEGSLSVVLSDGAETCRYEPIPTIERGQDPGAYFLLIPSKADADEVRLQHRATQLLRSAPWLRIVLPFQSLAILPTGL